MLYCKFCGEPLNEGGKCPNNHAFKKMCMNCAHLGAIEDAETGKASLVCMNEENKKAALEKMLKLLEGSKSGYAVKTLEIEPVPLKKPELKCGKWELSPVVREEVLDMFV